MSGLLGSDKRMNEEEDEGDEMRDCINQAHP